MAMTEQQHQEALQFLKSQGLGQQKTPGQLRIEKLDDLKLQKESNQEPAQENKKGFLGKKGEATTLNETKQSNLLGFADKLFGSQGTKMQDSVKNIGNRWDERSKRVVSSFDVEIGKDGIDPFLDKTLQDRGFTEKLKELQDLKTGGGLHGGLSRSVQELAGAATDIVGGGISAMAGLVGTPVMAAYELLPDVVKVPHKAILNYMGDEIMDTQAAQLFTQVISGGVEVAQKLKESDPLLYQDIGGVANIASWIPVGAFLKANTGAIANTADDLFKILSPKKVVGVIEDSIFKPYLFVGDNKFTFKSTVDAVKPAMARPGDVVKEYVSKVPGVKWVTKKVKNNYTRYATNDAIKNNIEKTLRDSPQALSEAYEQGVTLSNSRPFAMSTTQELAEAQKMIANKNLMELGEQVTGYNIVGKEFKYVLQNADEYSVKVGKNLNDFILKLPNNKLSPTDQTSISAKVLQDINQVSGLEGLRLINIKESVFKALKTKNHEYIKSLTDNMIFDFSNTTISQNKPAQKAITEFYNGILKKDSYLQLHTFRQEMFEYLGGKKSAGIILNKTEKEGINSMRKSLMTILDDIDSSPEYRALNTEFAKSVSALDTAESKLANIDARNPDMLEARLEELSRRLTGSVPADMMNMLVPLEILAAKNGYNSGKSVLQLAMLKNIINSYYPESAKTGFTGLLEKAGQTVIGRVPTSVLGVASKVAGGVAKGLTTPETVVTQREALRVMIDKLYEAGKNAIK